MKPREGNHQVGASRPRKVAALVVCALLLAVVVGARLWFAGGDHPVDAGLRLGFRPELTGYQCRRVEPTPQEREILATTNLFTGVYTNAGPDRFMGFFADWSATTAREMVVVQHTPDICWAGAGATVAELPQPRKVTLTLGGQPIEFECRVFQLPGVSEPEATIWCTLVGGRLFAEGAPWAREADAGEAGPERQKAAARRKSMEAFFETVRSRTPGNGSKQFIRISAPVRRDVETAIRAIVGFGEQWLTVENESGAGRGAVR